MSRRKPYTAPRVVSYRVERYRVRQHVEETACDFCGAPLYVGDVAFELDDESVVCSHRCAARLVVASRQESQA